jgi:hypothetical protein
MLASAASVAVYGWPGVSREARTSAARSSTASGAAGWVRASARVTQRMVRSGSAVTRSARRRASRAAGASSGRASDPATSTL